MTTEELKNIRPKLTACPLVSPGRDVLGVITGGPPLGLVAAAFRKEPFQLLPGLSQSEDSPQGDSRCGAQAVPVLSQQGGKKSGLRSTILILS